MVDYSLKSQPLACIPADPALSGSSNGNPPLILNHEKHKDSSSPSPEVPPVLNAIQVGSHDVPNGGFTAWLQVVGSFFLFMNSWGIVNTFGVYQSFYQSPSSKFTATPSDISWIGSIQAYLLLLVGVFAGPLYDQGHFRALISAGSLLVVLGMMMTSVSRTYWQVLLAQAGCVGIGCGFLFVPSVAIVSTYFSTRKAFATGIAASGSSLGGSLYPIIFHKLQPVIGFGWATRVLGFIMLGTLTISVTVMRMRVQPSLKRSLWDISALKEKPFIIFCTGMFFGFMGLYIPFFYVPSYAVSRGILTEKTAFYLLSVMNAASIFGRIIPNFVADKTGPFNVLIPATMATCIVGFAWRGVHDVGGLVIFCLLYGFFSGTFVSLPPTVMVTLSPDRSVLGTRMGMNSALGGLGLLIGTPVAGQLIKGSGFDAAIYYCGGVGACASVCFVLARRAKVGLGLRTIA